MAVCSIYAGLDEQGVTPEQAERLERIYLSRRATDARRHRERPVTEAEYRAEEIGGGQQGREPALSETAPLEPAPETPPRRRHRKPVVSPERRLSLEEMARTLTGKGRRS